MSPRVKLIVLATGVIIVLGIIVTLVLRGLSVGQLTVTTSDKSNSISIVRITPLPGKIDTKNAVGRYSSKLPIGTYTVTVSNKTSSAQQVVILKGGGSSTVNIAPPTLGSVELVSDINAGNVVTSNNSLRFLSLSDNVLKEINAQNQLTTISPTTLRSIIWASPDFGIARTLDGSFATVQGSTLTAIPSFFTPTANSTTFAVAPNKDVYLTDGKKVYRGNAGQNFQSIYESSKSVVIKSASNDGVLIIQSDPNVRGDSEAVIIHKDKTTVKAQEEAYDAVWSPSGDQILLNSDEESTVFDKKLGDIARLPQNNVTSPIWLNDTTLLYGVQNKLWQYNISTGQAIVVADTQAKSIGQIYLSTDKSYIYLSTQNIKDGKGLSLMRVGLKDQAVSKTSTILGLILPNTLGSCHLSYVNFTAPTVAVQGPKANAVACTATAQKYLQTYHVDAKTVGLSFSAP